MIESLELIDNKKITSTENNKIVFIENKNLFILNNHKENNLFILIVAFTPFSFFLFFVLFFSLRNINNSNIGFKPEINIEKTECGKLDPIDIFNLRIKKGPIKICENGKSSHICYQNNFGYYNNIFYHKNGVICEMHNIIIDPSKSRQTGIIYKGPVDTVNKGFPILSKGFFNMKCKNKTNFYEYNNNYKYYFDGWNYDYEDNKGEKIEELAPNKIIFFISRNQDSPNLFHGGSEIVNAVSMMYLLKLKPEDIQVIFLESMSLNDDPFYDLYKNVISRGGEPIYIKNLTKKYHISFGIHVPINWDSPCFILSYFPNCANPTKTYNFYNYLIDKYMNLPNFTDSFITDNETYYYPKTVIDSHNSGINFTKTITFQWRRPWPKERKTKQYRMLVNSIELVEKLSLYLPKNILLRMVNTASLPISKQIALMKKTDYLIGIHGAGLYLSVFLPEQTILHELLPAPNMIVFQIISILSGHKSYYDIIKSEITNSNDSEEIKFDENEFITKVLKRLKDNNFL